MSSVAPNVVPAVPRRSSFQPAAPPAPGGARIGGAVRRDNFDGRALGGRATGAVTPLSPSSIRDDDWTQPSLEDTFRLALNYPDKKIFLDSKVSNDPAVATRLAKQYVELLRRYPQLRDRVIVACPDKRCLDAMKQVFHDSPGFEDFKNFTLDDEHLNDKGVHGHTERVDVLQDSADNHYVSIGDPKAPGGGDFSDLMREVQEGLARTKDPKDPNYGKELLVWTINDEDKMRALAHLRPPPDGILTDNPDLLNRVLDQEFGPKGTNPDRPMVFCHRGGPENAVAPENTLPMIKRGFESGAEAIEIDVCSAKDGAILFHDNDPDDEVALLRDLGLEGGHFRPVQPDIGDPERKRLDRMTMSEIRQNYHYARNATDSAIANGIESLVRNALRYPGTWLAALGRALHLGFLTGIGKGLNYLVDKVLSPLLDKATQLGKLIVDGVIDAGKSAWGFLKGLLGGLNSLLAGLGRGATNLLRNLFGGVKDLLGGLFRGAGSLFSGIATGLGGLFSGIFGGGGNLLTRLGRGFSNLFGGLARGVSGLFGNLGRGISGFFGNLGRGISGFFGGIARGASSFFQNVAHGVKDAVSGAWDGIKNAASGLFHFVFG